MSVVYLLFSLFFDDSIVSSPLVVSVILSHNLLHFSNSRLSHSCFFLFEFSFLRLYSVQFEFVSCFRLNSLSWSTYRFFRSFFFGGNKYVLSVELNNNLFQIILFVALFFVPCCFFMIISSILKRIY